MNKKYITYLTITSICLFIICMFIYIFVEEYSIPLILFNILLFLSFAILIFLVFFPFLVTVIYINSSNEIRRRFLDNYFWGFFVLKEYR